MTGSIVPVTSCATNDDRMLLSPPLIQRARFGAAFSSWKSTALTPGCDTMMYTSEGHISSFAPMSLCNAVAETRFGEEVRSLTVVCQWSHVFISSVRTQRWKVERMARYL